MDVATYINCFEVPPGDDAGFITQWREVSLYMRDKPGFLGLRLHRALGDEAANRFVNYVNWRSGEHLRAAHDEGFRALVGQQKWRPISSVGRLYDIVESVGAIEV
jgi:heme-degrading monooxygenase HmoA